MLLCENTIFQTDKNASLHIFLILNVEAINLGKL